jgi:hypothetical protein
MVGRGRARGAGGVAGRDCCWPVEAGAGDDGAAELFVDVEDESPLFSGVLVVVVVVVDVAAAAAVWNNNNNKKTISLTEIIAT